MCIRDRDYSVRDQGATLDTLRTIAFRAMQKKLDAFGKLGLKLDESHRTAGEQHAAFFPLERYTDYQAHSSMSLNSKRRGQQVNDIRKPKTMFYNKVPYGRFDIVLHPDITEPPVQYTYNLTMQCQLPPAFAPKEVKQLVKYVWLTDKGDMREIHVP